MRGYVVKKGKNYYAVVYDGVDPGTGKEKRKWVSAGPRRGLRQVCCPSSWARIRALEVSHQICAGFSRLPVAALEQAVDPQIQVIRRYVRRLAGTVDRTAYPEGFVE